MIIYVMSNIESRLMKLDIEKISFFKLSIEFVNLLGIYNLLFLDSS